MKPYLILFVGLLLIPIECRAVDLYKNFAGAHDDAKECASAPPRGQIKILYTKNGTTVEGCGFWKAANSEEGQEIVKQFDDFESHPPDVVYRSSGKYPIYTQRVVSGGCEHHELNCQD